MTIEEMRNRKKQLHMTNRELAEKSGVPVSTVAKILSEATANPRRDTVIALERVLQPDYTAVNRNAAVLPPMNYVKEPDAPYSYGTEAVQYTDLKSDHRRKPAKTQGEFTISDYYEIPDDRRVEMIDGRIYEMASPTWIHQTLVMHIWKAIQNCIDEHAVPCQVVAAPFDVQLCGDNFTMVQPDVTVFCDKNEKLGNIRAVGAPDFVCEVLSPSTAFYDRHLKLFKYRDAGVREVWMVSYQQKTVEVYFFEESEQPAEYSMSEQIPLKISGGQCVVDFDAIVRKQIRGSFFYSPERDG